MANTQTVTILFTDMVGSAELSAALDPDAANELRQTHFGLLATGERLNDEAFAVASDIGTPEAFGVWGGCCSTSACSRGESRR